MDKNSTVAFNKKTIALAMIAAFGFGFYQGAQMLSFVVGHYTSNPFSLFGLLVEGALYLAFAAFSWRGKEVQPKWLLAVGVAFGMVFIGVALVNDQQPLFQIIFRTVASTSAACLLLCWAYTFSALPPLLSALSIASAFMISSLVKLFSAFAVAPETNESLYVQLFVFACCLALLCAAVQLTGTMSTNDLPKRGKESDAVSKTTPQRLRRLYVGAAAFSVAYGIVLQSDIETEISHYAQSDFTAIVTFAFAGAVLILSLLGSFKGNVNYLFIIIAPCLGVAVVAKNVFETGSDLGGAINTAVLNLYYMVLWITLAKEAHRRTYPAFFLFGIGLGVSRIALLCGRGVTALLVLNPSTSLAGYDFAPNLALLVMLCAACLFIVSNEKEQETPTRVLPAAEDDAAETPWIVAPDRAESQLLLAWSKLVDEKGLSKREAEILFEFLQGRSSSYIADHFFISEHTVKTHIRRGYEKLNIHGRQELISLVQSDSHR